MTEVANVSFGLHNVFVLCCVLIFQLPKFKIWQIPFKISTSSFPSTIRRSENQRPSLHTPAGEEQRNWRPVDCCPNISFRSPRTLEWKSLYNTLSIFFSIPTWNQISTNYPNLRFTFPVHTIPASRKKKKKVIHYQRIKNM